MARSNDMARLRSLCGEKGYELERCPGGVFRLVRVDIGHAVMHPRLRRPAFSVRDAISYLLAVEPE